MGASTLPATTRASPSIHAPLPSSRRRTGSGYWRQSPRRHQRRQSLLAAHSEARRGRAYRQHCFYRGLSGAEGSRHRCLCDDEVRRGRAERGARQRSRRNQHRRVRSAAPARSRPKSIAPPKAVPSASAVRRRGPIRPCQNSSDGLHPDAVGRRAEAIRDEKFYIFTHVGTRDALARRHARIIHAYEATERWAAQEAANRKSQGEMQ